MTEEFAFYERAVIAVTRTLIQVNQGSAIDPLAIAKQASEIARGSVKERAAYINEPPKGYPGPNT